MKGNLRGKRLWYIGNEPRYLTKTSPKAWGSKPIYVDSIDEFYQIILEAKTGFIFRDFKWNPIPFTGKYPDDRDIKVHSISFSTWDLTKTKFAHGHASFTNSESLIWLGDYEIQTQYKDNVIT